MSDHSPIPSPPPELLREWCRSSRKHEDLEQFWRYIATQAAQWGADQELEACLEHLFRRGFSDADILCLRAARRPKPPSLKEQALEVLKSRDSMQPLLDGRRILQPDELDTILRAVEALPNG